MKKKALITGIFGQDGSYCAELLWEKGYEVCGIARFHLSSQSQKIHDDLKKKGVNFKIYECDLYNEDSVSKLLNDIKPHELYHFATTHFSSELPLAERTKISSQLFIENVLSGISLIAAIARVTPETRLVLAGSCLMYDQSKDYPQTEKTPLSSSGFYGLSKINVLEFAKLYRKQNGLHISNAILYNHESVRRPPHFLSKKIVQHVAQMKKGSNKSIKIGSLHVKKDWGYAKDYVYGMWLMAQREKPDDYILATGISHTISDLIEAAFKAIDRVDWKQFIEVEPGIASSQNQVELLGDATKARVQLGWQPKLSFDEMVAHMVNCELKENLD